MNLFYIYFTNPLIILSFSCFYGLMLFFSVTAPVLVSDSVILLFNTSKICLYLYFSSTNNSKNLGAFSHNFTMFYINFTMCAYMDINLSVSRALICYPLC